MNRILALLTTVPSMDKLSSTALVRRVLARRQSQIDAMDKTAASRFNLLKQFIGKQTPLFHSMAGDNARGLIKHPKAMTSTEAVARGAATNVETQYGTARDAVTNSDMLVRPRLTANGAQLDAGDAVSAVIKQHTDPSDSPMMAYLNLPVKARQLAMTRVPGLAGKSGDAQLSRALNTLGPSKNWGSISFTSGRPNREYGDFGIMTTPSRLPASNTVLRAYRDAGSEVQVLPKLQFNTAGLPDVIQLPTAPGKVFYHPTSENAGLVRELIAAHGRHNVIPWNRQVRAQVSRISGSNNTVPYADINRRSLRTANLNKLPGYAANESKLDDWLNGLMG